MSVYSDQSADISTQDSNGPDALLQQAIQRFPALEGDDITADGDLTGLTPDYWLEEEASFRHRYPPAQELDRAVNKDPIVTGHAVQHIEETEHTNTASQLKVDSVPSQCTLIRRIVTGAAPKKPSPWVLSRSERTSSVSSAKSLVLSGLVKKLSTSTLAFISSRLPHDLKVSGTHPFDTCDQLQDSADTIFMLESALWTMSSLQCGEDYNSQYAINAYLIDRNDQDHSIIQDTLLANLRSFQEAWECTSKTTPLIYRSDHKGFEKEVRDVLRRIKDLTEYDLNDEDTEQPESQAPASCGGLHGDSVTAADELTLRCQVDESDLEKSVAGPSERDLNLSSRSPQEEHSAVAAQSTPDPLHVQESQQPEEEKSSYDGRNTSRTCTALLTLAAAGLAFYGLQEGYLWLTQETEDE